MKQKDAQRMNESANEEAACGDHPRCEQEDVELCII